MAFPPDQALHPSIPVPPRSIRTAATCVCLYLARAYIALLIVPVSCSHGQEQHTICGWLHSCDTLRIMKVVLFDLDGTLVKAGGSGRRALNRAVKTLHGVDDICSRFSIVGRMDKENFHIAVCKAIGRKPSVQELRAVQNAYLKHLPRE